MFAIAVDFLTGRYYAAAYDDRNAGEWPPHPARLYSALTAAWTEGDRPAEEARALDWLATASAPAIRAAEATFRDTPTFYVPVNDAAVLRTQEKLYKDYRKARQELCEARRVLADPVCLDAKARGKAKKVLASKEKAFARQQRRAQKWAPPFEGKLPKTGPDLLPERRIRQPRTFPSATPADTTVWFIWEDAEPSPETRRALDALASRVVRLGHSASLVACHVTDEAPEATHSPHPDGELLLRVVAEGQRQQLVEEFAHHQGNEPRVMPARIARYRQGASAPRRRVVTSSLDGGWIVFGRVHGPRFPSRRAVDVAEKLRGALMCHADQPVHRVLSGHLPDGRPLGEPHALFVPLPYVGSRYADGALLGVAVVLPHDVDREGRRQVLRAIGRWEGSGDDGVLRLTFARAGVLELARIPGLSERRTLLPATWSRPSMTWASATPVALDRNPGPLYSRNPKAAARAAAAAEETLRRACERIGLPRPARVEVGTQPTLPGVLPARAFAPFPRPRGKLRRVLVHAALHFAEPIRGPLVLGAGRHRGLGLMRPVSETQTSRRAAAAPPGQRREER